MKGKMKQAMVLAFFMLFAAGTYAATAEPMKGCSHTEFGDYTITLSDDPLILNKKELLTYELQYSNLKQTVIIGFEKTKKCRNFVVKYPNFEVQYVCTKHGFGVKRIDPKYKSVHPEAVSAIMDETQFNYQEVIVNGWDKENEELLHLIACYFPKLVDEEVRKMARS